MSTTVDCGEGKHILCIGWGTEPYLFPQQAGERFDCACICHLDPAKVKYAHEYEKHLGDGRFQVYAGHPGYCQIAERHPGHEHRYAYRMQNGEVVFGRTYCDGWERKPFPERPHAMEEKA